MAKSNKSKSNSNFDDQEKGDNETGNYWTKKEPRKSLGVYLKNQNKLIMSSISIADKKAAILIRVNTAIISALIVFESYFESNLNFNKFMIPTLIIGLSVSLFCALLAAKPFSYTMYNILNKVVKNKYPKLESNNFMLLEDVEFDEYEESMKKVVNSQDLQIGNMTRFNYFMSKSISGKFVLLEIAYLALIITFFIITVMYVVIKFV